MLVAGEWVHGDEPLEVHHPYDGSLVETTTYATKAQVEAAVAAADGVRAEAAAAPDPRARRRPWPRVSRQIAERAEEIAELITAENGKPLNWARARSAARCRCSAGPPRRPAGSPARCSGSTPTPRPTGRMALRPPRAQGPGAGDHARSTSRSTWSPTRSPRRSRSARPIVLKPAPDDPAVRAAARRAARRDRPARRAWSTCCRAERPGRGPRRRPAAAGGRRSPAPGRSATRSRSRSRASTSTLELGGNAAAVVCGGLVERRGPRLGGDPDRDLRQLPGRPVLHRRAAGVRRRVAVRRAPATGSSPRSRRCRTGDPNGPDTTSARWSSEAAAQRVEAWVNEAVDAGATRR